MKLKFFLNKNKEAFLNLVNNSTLNNREKFWLVEYIQPVFKKKSITVNCSKKYFFNSLFHQLISPQMLFFGFLTIFRNSKKSNFYYKIFSQSFENYSLAHLINLYDSLKKQIYKPMFLNNKSCFNDFIVQECLQLILKKVFNSQNSPQPKIALEKIKASNLIGYWNYGLEVELNPYDFKIHFLLSILKQNIKDKKFLNLVLQFHNRKFLSKAYILTLFSIYLSKFDLYIEKEIQKYQQQHKKIFYIRYGNELIITLYGNYIFIVLIRNKIKTWLITKSVVKPQKIFIKKLKKQSLCFLGFSLFFQKHKLRITIDKIKVRNQLKNHSFLHNNKSLQKNTWVQFSDFQIVLFYSNFIRRIFNYYYLHINNKKQLYWIYYIVKTSCVKTLCMKYKKRTMKKILQKYDKDLTIPNQNIYFPSIKELITNSKDANSRMIGNYHVRLGRRGN
nr:Reverse transcriptases (RT) with group II intron origin; type II intron maturase [Rhipidosiphon lewmanomontiae]